MEDTRFDRGFKKLAELKENRPSELMDELKDISPDLARYIIEFAFGDIYSRPVFDNRTKELMIISSLTAMRGCEPQLKNHIQLALSVGISKQEIVEAILLMCSYAGFPAVLNGVNAAKEVFDNSL